MRNRITVLAGILFSLLAIFVLSFSAEWLSDGFAESGYASIAIITNFSFPVLIFLLVRWFNKRFNKRNAYEYGFGVSGFPKKILAGLLIAVATVACILLVAALFGITVTFTALHKNALLPLMQIMAANCMVGAWEEMYFRGLVFNTLLKGKLSFSLSAFVTAALFTALHSGTYNMQQTAAYWFVVVILLSYILLYLYLYTQSIWTPIAFHSTWDFFWELLDDTENKAGLLQIKQYSQKAILLDNISLPVLAVVLLAIVYLNRKKVAAINASDFIIKPSTI